MIIMLQVKEGVYWVGSVDWDIKNFHGYITHRGTSYNSYLLLSDKVALVDSVKAPFYEAWVRHIKDIIMANLSTKSNPYRSSIL